MASVSSMWVWVLIGVDKETPRSRTQRMETCAADHPCAFPMLVSNLPDTNSPEGLMHWYYYRMFTQGVERGTKIKMNIRNLHRTKSLYECGMLPKLLYGTKNNKQKLNGWVADAKVTTNVRFFQSN